MKKFLFMTMKLLLVMALVFSSINVSANDIVEDGKVFSLDFSSLEKDEFATAGDIKNGVTDSTANITVLKYAGAPEEVTGPKVGSFTTQTGETVKYLTFANEEPTDSWSDSDMYYGGVNLNKTLMESMVTDKQTMSVEFWVKRHANAETRSNGLRGSKGGHIFRFGTNSTADGGDGTVQHINMEAYMFAGTGETNDGNIYMRPVGKYIKFSDGTKVSSEGAEAVTLATTGEWDHYVYTKQITEDGNQVKYEAVVYKNGESIYTIDTSTDEAYSGKTVIRQPDAGNLSFTIGGYSTSTANGIPNADCKIGDIFDGAIAEFNIYNRALTATEVETKFEEKEDVYKSVMVETIEGMSLVSPLEGSQIDSAANMIPITFSNYVKFDTIDNIVFEKFSGEPVKGGYTIEVAEDITKTVIIKYGDLEPNTKYVIRIPTTVKSINDYEIQEDVEIVFKTSSNAIFELDLTDEEVNTVPQFTHPNIFFSSSRVANDKSDFMVVELEKNGVKRKVLRMGINNRATDPESYFGFRATSPTTEELVIEAGYKEEGTVSNRGFRWKQNKYILDSFAKYKKDDFDFYRFKFVFSYDSVNGKYECSVYDMNRNNEFIEKRSILDSESQTLTNVLYQMYNATANPEAAIYIDHYKVYPYKTPVVMSSNTENISLDEEVISLTFSDDLNIDTIGEGSVVLLNTMTNREIPVSVVGYDEEFRTISIRPLEYFDPDTEYKISFNGIKGIKGDEVRSNAAVIFTTESDAKLTTPVFKNQNGAGVTSLNGATSVVAEINYTNETEDIKNPYMFLIYYDAKGMAKKVVTGTVMVLANETEPLSAEISDINPQPDSYIKCFVWDTEDGKTIPILLEPAILHY